MGIRQKGRVDCTPFFCIQGTSMYKKFFVVVMLYIPLLCNGMEKSQEVSSHTDEKEGTELQSVSVDSGQNNSIHTAVTRHSDGKKKVMQAVVQQTESIKNIDLGVQKMHRILADIRTTGEYNNRAFACMAATMFFMAVIYYVNTIAHWR